MIPRSQIRVLQTEPRALRWPYETRVAMHYRSMLAWRGTLFLGPEGHERENVREQLHWAINLYLVSLREGPQPLPVSPTGRALPWETLLACICRQQRRAQQMLQEGAVVFRDGFLADFADYCTRVAKDD